MRTDRKKKHWFLKYPLVPAFVLPTVGIVGVALLLQLLLAALLGIFGDGIRSFQELPDVLNSVLRILLAFCMILVMKKSSGGQFRFGFHKNNLWPSVLFSMVSMSVVLSNLMEYSAAGLPFHNTWKGVAIAALSGIAPGFFEEVVCRGIVVSNMMRRWKNKDRYMEKTVLLSGLAFGLVHLINLANGDISGTILQIRYAAALGIFFGGVFVRTHNLWGPVILHSLIDFSAFIFNGEAETTAFTVTSSIGITIIYTAVGLYLIRRKKQDEIRELWEEQGEEEL